ILFGQPELDQMLSAPENRQIMERVSSSFHLPPLTRRDTGLYLRHRLEATGHAHGEVFTNGALWFLHRTAQGGLRRINVLAHKALIAAFSDASPRVKLRHVRSALAASDYAMAAPLWMRPVLVASSLALAIIGGTVLHSLANTPWVSGIPGQEATGVAERMLDKGVSEHASSSDVAGGMLDKGVSEGVSSAPLPDSVQVAALPLPGADGLRTGTKIGTGPESGNAGHAPEKVADADGKKVTPAPGKMADKSSAKSSQRSDNGGQAKKEKGQSPGSQVALPSTDDIVFSVATGTTPSASPGLTGSDRVSGAPAPAEVTVVRDTAGEKDQVAQKPAATEPDKKISYGFDETELGLQPDPKQNYPYLKREDPLADKIIASHIWVETSENAHFTIQLMILSRDDGLATLEKDLAGLGQQLGGRRVNVVRLRDDRLLVYLDEFATHKEAEAFIAALPASLKVNQPLVIPLKQARARVHRSARVSG
ncbi:MAG: hypothetical protein HQL62_09035, partial [Magnetococcales bacterium]|nr:hypothetical protein [Magnetococcales bacterium]